VLGAGGRVAQQPAAKLRGERRGVRECCASVQGAAANDAASTTRLSASAAMSVAHGGKRAGLLLALITHRPWRRFLPTWARLGPWQLVFWTTYEGMRQAAGLAPF